jgi:hypothetical protein
MLEHYSHIRIDAKRQALDALDAARRTTAPNGNGDGEGSRRNEEGPDEGGIDALVEVSDELTSQSRHSLRLSGSPPHGKLFIPLERRDVRVVEGARLESVCRGNSTVGSNPTLSANLRSRLPSTRELRLASHAKVVRRSAERAKEDRAIHRRSRTIAAIIPLRKSSRTPRHLLAFARRWRARRSRRLLPWSVARSASGPNESGANSNHARRCSSSTTCGRGTGVRCFPSPAAVWSNPSSSPSSRCRRRVDRSATRSSHRCRAE